MRTLVLAWFISGVMSLAAELRIYVHPEGNDDWTGQEQTPNTADKDKGPVRTLGRALDRARGAGPSSRPVTIVLPPGRNELHQPITLRAEDSGLTITSSGTNRAVISGGRAITNWRTDERNPKLWHADIPEAQRGGWIFRQLFVEGERKTRARTPNTDYYRINGPSPQDRPVRLRFQNDEIKPGWAGTGVEVVALLAWADIRMPIRSVDVGSQTAVLAGDPRPSNKENNARYYLENSAEFLDSPGEWFLDTEVGRVSYWHDGPENLNSLEVIAPLLEDLVVLDGEPESPIRNIKFKNVEFSHTNWTLPEHGYADTRAAVSIRGDVRADYAEDCVIEDCRFSHLAGYAIDLGRGCKRFTVAGNEIVDIGGGGIRIGETSRPGPPSEHNYLHTITDNHLHQLGRVYAPAVGIFVLHSGTNRIAYNRIHDLYYTAISVGWNWGYQETPCRENIIEHNHLYHIGQGRLSDMGAVYTLGIQRGTVIRNNLIHDVDAFAYGGWGLYTDEGSSYILLEGNTVYRCKNAGFHQHYGRENIVRGNIFALNKENQLMRTRPEEHVSFYLTNNVVFFDSGHLLGSNWSNDNYVIDHNNYYDTRLGADQEKMNFAGMSLPEWRARGHDLHSTFAEPGFVAPREGDFTLHENSPVKKLGIRPLTPTEVGPRKNRPLSSP